MSTKILFIGNSFTTGLGGANVDGAGVPALFEGLIQESHPDVIVDKSAVPSRSMSDYVHGTDIDTLTKIQEHWDIVVIQGGSIESIAGSTGYSDFLNCGKKLVKKIRRCSPNAKIVLYETWAYPGVPDATTPAFVDQELMLSQISGGYKALATSIRELPSPPDVSIAPVGHAFAKAQHFAGGSYALYDSFDNKHANDMGYTLAALVIVRTIFGSLSADPPVVFGTASPDQMRDLASIANDAVNTYVE